MTRNPEFDLVVYGATGFTGQLIAQYLVHMAAGRGLKVAFSGRSLDKLESLRAQLGAGSAVTLIEADAANRHALDAMVARTRVVISAVGPYQLYGEPLVAACATAGTDYLDLSGEVAWMRRMIDRYEKKARASGARILFSCGFDSVPFELGVLYLQHHARTRFGLPVPRIRGRITGMRGGYSGGTLAAGAATAAAIAEDANVGTLLQDPFALTPGFHGAAQPGEEQVPTFDEVLAQWTAPFVLASINTRNVHRSNYLQHDAYGSDFCYDERVLTGTGEGGRKAAEQLLAAQQSGDDSQAPKPGEGPSKAEREAGYYDVLFVGLMDDGRRIDVTVHGDRDPGYGSTCKIISETAVALLQQGHAVAGGVWTPGAALGLALVHQLEAHAGVSFSVAEA